MSGLAIVVPSLELKVMTFNIWFADYFLVARTLHIAAMLVDLQPDVVCLQEVRGDTFNILRRHKQLQELYQCSAPPRGSSYFVCMMVRKAHRAVFKEYPLESTMGRTLLTCQLYASQGDQPQTAEMLTTPDLMIATSHFESLDSKRTRRKQLEVASEVVQCFPDRWLLCGDFNFCSYQNYRGNSPNDLENDMLQKVLPPHRDVWSHLHPLQGDDDALRGYTFDSTRNENINHHERMRYDRVVVSSSDAHVSPLEISLIGTEPLSATLLEQFPEEVPTLQLPANRRRGGGGGMVIPPGSPPVVLPSDHFGLLCSVKVVRSS